MIERAIARTDGHIEEAARLRDGSRKITHVTEIIGMEGEVVTLQDLFIYEIQGEDASGRIVGRHKFTGLRPAFWDQAKYFGRERELGFGFIGAGAIAHFHARAVAAANPSAPVTT